jgi:hypothetical protein
MKTSRLPIAIQQAVMRSLREKPALANQKLGVTIRNPNWFISNGALRQAQPGSIRMKSA